MNEAASHPRHAFGLDLAPSLTVVAPRAQLFICWILPWFSEDVLLHVFPARVKNRFLCEVYEPVF